MYISEWKYGQELYDFSGIKWGRLICIKLRYITYRFNQQIYLYVFYVLINLQQNISIYAFFHGSTTINIKCKKPFIINSKFFEHKYFY